MILRNLRIESRPKLMIIPMIDIIFFLLVFFMMNTLYMVDQRTIPVALPQSSAARSDITKQVVVTVAAPGTIFIEDEEVTIAKLQQHVEHEMTTTRDSAFVLRADRQAEYGTVIAVLDLLKMAGVQHVGMATDSQ